MLPTGRSFLVRAISALLIVCSAGSAPAMTLMAARGDTMMPGSHHDCGERGPSQHHLPSNNCCNACLFSCSTAPTVPAGTGLAQAPVRAFSVGPSVPQGRPTVEQVPHRLPPQIGPPTFQA